MSSSDADTTHSRAPWWLPHLLSCPVIIIMRLCRMRWGITRTMLHLAWSVIKVKSVCVLCPNCFHKGKKRGNCHWKVTSDGDAGTTYFVGKPVASLGPGLQMWRKMLPTLEQPSDCFPLLMFQVGSDKTAAKCPRAIKRHFRSSRWLSKGSGAQEMFSSILSGTENDEGRNSRSILDSKLGVTSRILDFWFPICLKWEKGSLCRS